MTRRLPRPTPATAIAFVALFVALGGTSVAITRSGIPDRTGTFHACVDERTGAVRLVRTAAECRKHPGRAAAAEQAVAWNQAGREGARGQAGRVGAPGPAGPVGPAGQTGPTGPSDAYSSGPKDGGTEASVTLPPGDYVASGGCTATQTMTSGQSTTVPAFGEAQAFLTTDDGFFTAGPFAPGTVESDASVPNMGSTVPPESSPRSGSASLANGGGFELPAGGTIYEICRTAVVGHEIGGSDEPLSFSGTWLTAIRVGALHSS